MSNDEMVSAAAKSFNNPDETKTPPKTNAATIKLGEIALTKVQLEPGWKWSECVKPAVGEKSCHADHVGIVVQGSIHCVQDDGTEVMATAGYANYFGPGHDGWVVGDDTFIAYEFSQDAKDFGPWKTA